MAYYLSDSDEDPIPEIELSIRSENVQPYMYEPRKADYPSLSEDDSETSSSSESDLDPSAADPLPSTVDEWCSCGNCREMRTSRENKCCHATNGVDAKLEEGETGYHCITEHEGFIANCLNRHVLEVSFFEYLEDNGPLPEDERVHRIYRHIAYRRFVRWVWRILGRRNRRVLPSCVVTKIRHSFPSQQYCGFQYPI